jgi:hypothetical protein
MSTNLIRIADLSGAINTDESRRLYDIARQSAHSHPRKNKTMKNIFGRLRKMAIEAGVWETHKSEYSQ